MNESAQNNAHHNQVPCNLHWEFPLFPPWKDGLAQHVQAAEKGGDWSGTTASQLYHHTATLDQQAMTLKANASWPP